MNTALFLIIGIPLIEIYLFIKIGSQIGAFNTVLLILITAITGVAYARYEGFNTLKYSFCSKRNRQHIHDYQTHNVEGWCPYPSTACQRITGVASHHHSIRKR